jgi:hypothetical protein
LNLNYPNLYPQCQDINWQYASTYLYGNQVWDADLQLRWMDRDWLSLPNKENESPELSSGFSARALFFVKIRIAMRTHTIFLYVRHTNKMDDIIMSPITRKQLDVMHAKHTLCMSRTLWRYLLFIYTIMHTYIFVYYSSAIFLTYNVENQKIRLWLAHNSFYGTVSD